MDELDKFKVQIERMILKRACMETGIPENTISFLDCLIKNGCPIEAVLNGIKEYAEKEILKDLLKDVKEE